MTCQWIKMPDGGHAILCNARRTRARCSVAGCKELSAKQCDYPRSPQKTCDRHLCAKHAVPMGDNVDWCPDHPRLPQAQGRLSL